MSTYIFAGNLVLSKDELPKGGVLLLDPIDSQKKYYWFKPKGNNLVHGGYRIPNFLYTHSGGVNWWGSDHHLDFESMFMHGETGMLIGTIAEFRMKKGADGFLNPVRKLRLVKSMDGRQWQDFSEIPLLVDAVFSLWEDPVNTKRICALLRDENGTGLFIFKDDTLSGWTRFDENSFDEMKSFWPAPQQPLEDPN